MQQHSNQINMEQRGAITLFDIRGDLTSFSEPFLSEAYQNANEQGAAKILLKIEKENLSLLKAAQFFLMKLVI